MPTDTAEHSPKPAPQSGDGAPQQEAAPEADGRRRDGHHEVQVGSDAPIIGPGQSYGSITDKITGIVLNKKHPKLVWWSVFGIGFLLTQVMFLTLTYLVVKGIGIFGNNIPVAWGFPITNFVWWIGIGHAGTLISAILVLVRQDWRTSINRFAEAMTLFAVMCAGMMPLVHLGRPWLFYYILPYPNTMNLWPQFKSPLVWDVFAVSTYFTVSLIFWYTGLIPDVASMRDRAKSLFSKRLFGVLALGWRGSVKHWQRYQTAYLMLAGLATPLVISVHSIVGLDFAYAIVPGWHSTIFPPYFVAGAIFSGFAMVLTLVIPIRKLYGLEKMVTMRHMDFCAKMMLTTGLITGYGYIAETFFGWYSGNEYEMFMTLNRLVGPYDEVWWIIIFCNMVSIHILWFPNLRHTMWILWIESIIVNIGMWLERYMIIVTSLHRDYLPSSWDMFHGTFWDWTFYISTIGFFVMMMFLFVRCVPMISMTEMRELLHEEEKGTTPEELSGGDGAAASDFEKKLEESPTASPYSNQQTRS